MFQGRDAHRWWRSCEEAYSYEVRVSVEPRDSQAQRRAGLVALPAGASCGPLRKGHGSGMAPSSAVLSQLSCLKLYPQEGNLQQCGEPVWLLCGAMTHAAACEMSVSACHSARGRDRCVPPILKRQHFSAALFVGMKEISHRVQ